jgi:hypothetical protein
MADKDERTRSTGMAVASDITVTVTLVRHGMALRVRDKGN